MSIFPDVTNNQVANGSSSGNIIEYGKSPLFDFTNGEFIRDGAQRIISTSDADTLLIWIRKALTTARGKYLAYTWDFGNDFLHYIGTSLSEDVLIAEAERLTKEALLGDNRINEVKDFQGDFQGGQLFYSFRIIPIYGDDFNYANSWEVS